jgi:hypothetical protein
MNSLDLSMQRHFMQLQTPKHLILAFYLIVNGPKLQFMVNEISLPISENPGSQWEDPHFKCHLLFFVIYSFTRNIESLSEQ